MSDFTEDCKNCYNWLLRSGVITAEVCAITDLYELGCLLKDGVILCQLSNHLSPFSIDANEYSHRSQMPQFLCLKNIRLFLHACRLRFNIKDEDLFEAMDLYEMKDLPKVLHTLSQLSQSDHNNKQLQPFYVKNQSAIYDFKSLHNHHNDQSQNTKTSHDRHEGDVYGRLVDFQPLNAPRDPQPMPKRELCIRELAVTEHNFIDALKMIKQYFMDPLESLMKPQDFQTIFSYVDILTKVHTGFYSDLVKACINSNIDYNINNNSTNNNFNNNNNNLINDMDLHCDLSIPDCFIKHKESFLIYGSFCSNLVKAQNLLDDLCAADPAISKQVEKSQLEANEGRFKLRDLLAVPMQRVLKYHLFLKELIKNTGVSHKDRKSLERALEEIQDLSLYVNEVKRDNDALLLLDEISRSIIGYEMPENMSLKDYGRLINDGEVKLKAHSDHKNKSRYAFLFDKVLLFCKLKGESFYSFKSALVVTSFKIEDVNAKEKNFGYTFVLGERNMTNTYTVGCRTLELKNKWIAAIRTAQDNVSPEHSHNYLHSFEMASFHQTTICDICRKLLKGLFYQGYLCQKTNMVVHKECIEKARELPGPPKPPPKSTHKLKFSYSDRGSSSSLSPMTKTPNKYPHDHPFYNKSNGMSKPPFQNQASLDSLSNLSNYPWYVGSMSRDDATSKLEGCMDGSFLVRASMSDQRRGEYALSIKYGNEMAVKHIKIQRNFEGLFFIADCKIFKNIPDLVGYYEKNSLQPSFSEVPTTLLYPYKKAPKMPSSTRRQTSQEQSSVISYCIAMYDYPASETNQLELKAGDRVAVLSKQAAGWWKGALNGQIGYFPSSFVKEAEDEKNLIKFNQPLL